MQLGKNYFPVKRKNFARLVKKWKRLSDTLGCRVKVRTAQGIFIGKAVDIGPEGALVLEIGKGKKEKILAGDCYYLRRK